MNFTQDMDGKWDIIIIIIILIIMIILRTCIKVCGRNWDSRKRLLLTTPSLLLLSPCCEQERSCRMEARFHRFFHYANECDSFNLLFQGKISSVSLFSSHLLLLANPPLVYAILKSAYISTYDKYKFFRVPNWINLYNIKKERFKTRCFLDLPLERPIVVSEFWLSGITSEYYSIYRQLRWSPQQ